MTTPGWSALPGISGPDSKRLLARALELADDDAMRSRILARVAVEENFLDPVAGDRTCDTALALARRSGDPSALAEALLRRASLCLSPRTLAQRLPVVDELLQLTLGTTDIAMRYFALSNAEVTAVQAADMTRADEHRAEAEALASQYDLSPVRWSAMLRGVWRSALAGDLDRAEAQIAIASDFGSAHGAAHAPDLALVQRSLLGWQRRDTTRALDAARAAYESFFTTFPGAALLLARFLVDNPASRTEARELVEPFAECHFTALTDGSFWATGLVLAAETAHCLGLAEACRTIRDLLLPYADQVAFTGMWVVAPVAYGIGVAADGCGDDRADTYLEQALEVARALHAPTQVDRVLHTRALLA